MSTILRSVIIGAISAAGCAFAGQISLIEAIAIYSIVGTTSAMLIVFLPGDTQLV